WRVTGGGVMARHWQDACVDAVAKLPPLRAPQFLGNDPAWSFAPSSNPRPTRDATTGRLTTAHDWRGHRSRSRAGRTGQCQCSRVIAPPGALGRTWLTCHWWPRDGKALAGRVSRSCREAAAPPGTPVLGNDPGGAWRLPLNPQRRLIPTRRRGGAPARSRCHRSARALGTWLACHWWRRDGKALAGRV